MMQRIAVSVLALAVLVGTAACGGGGGEPALVAAPSATAALLPTPSASAALLPMSSASAALLSTSTAPPPILPATPTPESLPTLGLKIDITDPDAEVDISAPTPQPQLFSVSVLSSPIPDIESAVVRLEPTSARATAMQEVDIEVKIEGVSGLGGFEFTLGFDPAVIEIVGGTGSDFLASSAREFMCIDTSGRQKAEAGSLYVLCVTLGAPPCLGGLPGASGSGTLAVLRVRPVNVGRIVLRFDSAMLVSDDVDPCDGQELQPVKLPAVAVDAVIVVEPAE